MRYCRLLYNDMLRMIQSRSAEQAKKYFNDALLKSDYFFDSQELKGNFNGKLAARLGVTGVATKEAFHRLCSNLHPVTSQKLTQRTITNRTTGYDINFHVPKSVSILHALSQDGHILNAFRDSVHETMRHIETDTKTRVRKDGKDHDRVTGELLYADFIHQTSRPVAGFAPDPHLHCHCFTFNATWDETEQSFKAAQFRDIKADMPYYQAYFFKTLSDRLMALGYKIKPTAKSFEIEGVPQEAIELLSKRTNEIGQVAKRDHITGKEQLAALGSKTRARKQKGASMTALKKEWRRQLAKKGMDAPTKPIRYKEAIEAPAMPASAYVDFALAHHLERASTVQDRRLLATALQAGIGTAVNGKEIADCLNNDTRIIRSIINGKSFCTTHEVLAEERRMINLATFRQGNKEPLYTSLPVLSLKGEHAQAARLALTSHDPVVMISGRAGVGKTTMMREVVNLIEATGKQVIPVAPTSQAARSVLKDEGFDNATTVAALLVNRDLQQQLKGQVLWVEEAGLLGVKEMTAILEVAQQQGARVVLSGDTMQHASVARGDAMRILQSSGKVREAVIKTIYRQKNERYRQAVYDLSNGNVKDGFGKLDSLQAFVNIDPANPYKALLNDYMAAISKGKTALIVSPTHQQGEDVTKAIRSALQKQGKIGKRETILTRLVNRNLTEAEKSSTINYRPGDVLQFNKSRAAIKRGSRLTIIKASSGKLHLQDETGKRAKLDLQESALFDVYEKKDLPVSTGDLVRVTRNQPAKDAKRLNNGQMLHVAKISKKTITLCSADKKAIYTIPKEFGHLAHAYCITSHASQGKTVDEVFIMQPADTFPATDSRQFYVSVSRGRENVRIYTDDKDALLARAAKTNNRLSAIELLMMENCLFTQPVQERPVTVAIPSKEKRPVCVQ